MSSAEKALSLREAREVGLRVVEKLRPFCDRIEIAGSIRRQKPWVNDVEIVLIPKSEKRERQVLVQAADLWTADVYRTEIEVVRDPGYAVAVTELAVTIVRGVKLGEAKYTQILVEGGTKVDLFTARPENWGYIFAIRTGSHEYSQGLLARGNRLGLKGVEGMWTRFGKPIEVREEKEVFSILGIRYVPPTERG